MVMNRLYRKGVVAVAAVLLGMSTLAFAKYEKEQLQLENALTQRIEGILSKALPPSSFLVTVKVEMQEGGGGGVNRKVNTRGGENPFLQKSKFVLPGVPAKKEFNTTPEVTEESTVVSPPAESLIKKVSVSILVAEDVAQDQIRSLRDLVASAISFNPIRGDELDIQPSSLLKPSQPVVTPAGSIGSGAAGHTPTGRLFDRNSIPFLFVMTLLALGLIGLALFLFGPVRAFLNRLLAVLPRVGEQAMYAANAGGTAAATPGAGLGGTLGLSGEINSRNNGDSGPKLEMPFQFVREEQLSKLALIFRELSSSEAALVLAYLPPEWASRLLSNLDPTMQTAITTELSQGREVPAEVVKQVEEQIRQKLPYMVGGTNWIQDIFPHTKPQTQRLLLGNLAQQSPELARSLRQKTFFYEDLPGLGPSALRILVQEMTYPLFARSMKDEKKEFQAAILNKLPGAMRDIIQQELDLTASDKRAITEAKIKLIETGSRLLATGRMSLGEVA
jgi:flagellar motor switch protein FliG